MGQDFWKASSIGTGARGRLDSFLEALVYKTKAADKSKIAYRNVSFPKLRCIHLEGIDFESVDMLLDCLMERCERNAEVQVLGLEDCDIFHDEVERLKDIVVDVYLYRPRELEYEDRHN